MNSYAVFRSEMLDNGTPCNERCLRVYTHRGLADSFAHTQASRFASVASDIAIHVVEYDGITGNELVREQVGPPCCNECGEQFQTNNDGTTNHTNQDGDVDYDADLDHVAFAEYGPI